MARVLKETFKGNNSTYFNIDTEIRCLLIIDRLLSKPLKDNFDIVPSPEELKYKVILRVEIFFYYV